MCHKRYSLLFSFGVCGKEQEEKEDKNLISKYRYSLSNPILAMAHVLQVILKAILKIFKTVLNLYYTVFGM